MKQALILVVGQNTSGKTYISKRLARDLSLERVNGDDFRMFLATHTQYFKDINLSKSNKKMEQLSELVMGYRFGLANTLLDSDCSLIFEGSG